MYAFSIYDRNLDKIIQLLKNDKIVSIISDAGTPCISDPGNILINECVDLCLEVQSVSGKKLVDFKDMLHENYSCEIDYIKEKVENFACKFEFYVE